MKNLNLFLRMYGIINKKPKKNLKKPVVNTFNSTWANLIKVPINVPKIIDIIIEVIGPPVAMNMFQKENKYGVWINKKIQTFKSIPSFYSISGTKPLEDLLPIKGTELFFWVALPWVAPSWVAPSWTPSWAVSWVDSVVISGVGSSGEVK